MILLWFLAFDTQASIDTTVGSSKSKQETHTKGTEAVSSTVAGKVVNIITTGAGTDSNIHVQGSNVSGTDATRLIADNNVIIESAQNTSEEHSSNKSSGWNAGVVVGTQGIGITAGGNVGKGKGEGTGVTQVNTHVGSSTGNTLISAGGDTTLAGAQVLGKRVELDTNNLTIESRQDTNQYHSKQKDMSAQFTVGAGASVSGSYSQNKVNADYASVNEQSGILAGDGGYQVNVKKHTDLKGGIITSTQAAEDARRNSFSTGTLSASDIQNHADYSASGFSIGGNVDINGGWTGQAANGGTGVNKSIGYGSDSGHDSSVTTSGINTSNISITDVAGQNATGTSVEQIKAQVKTATTTDTVQANSGAIANNFDKDAVQKEIGLQVSVTQQFDNTRQGVKAEINKHIDGLQAELKAAKTSDEKAAIEQKINSWQNAGTLTDMIAGGLSAPTSSALGIAAATAAPAVQYQIGQIFKDNQAKNELDKLMTGTAGTRPEEGSALHVLAHTVLAAAVAAAGGNDALTAGLSAGGAELLAPKVANWLFGNTAGVEKDENDNVIASKLTAEQKQTVSNIVSLGAAGLTAGAGGTGADVVSNSQLASSAVEDNWLTAPEKAKLAELVKACSLNSSYSNPACSQAGEIRKEDLDRDVMLAKSVNVLLASGSRLGSSAVTEEEAMAWNHINWAVQFLCPNGQCNDPDYKALWQLSQKTPKYFDQFVAESHPEDYILAAGGVLKIGVKGLAGVIANQFIKTEVKAVSALDFPDILKNFVTTRNQLGQTGSVRNQLELENLFKELTRGGRVPVEKTANGYSFKEVTLGDGTTVTMRSGSSSGGPTIDINYKNSIGGKGYKIHIDGWGE